MPRSDSYRIKTSNCVSCLVWFGAAIGGIQKNAQHIFLKEANAAASQLRSPAGCGGETSMFVGANELKRQIITI